MLRLATGLGKEPGKQSCCSGAWRCKWELTSTTVTILDQDKQAPSAFSADAVRKIGFNPDASAGLLSGDEKDEKVGASRRKTHTCLYTG